MTPQHRTGIPLSARLWAGADDVAKACLAHPFVTGLADGSLPRPAFEHYVAQDAFFLDAFARAHALGLARSPDQATAHRFKALLDGAVEELELHAGFAARWAVDLAPSPSPATRAYTDFLLHVAALEPVAHLCAAMTPCMRLYAWLGQSLEPATDPASAYHEWVITYAAAEFEDLAATMESLLDDMATGADEGRIADRYRTATQLELSFFDSAHRVGTAGGTDSTSQAPR